MSSTLTGSPVRADVDAAREAAHALRRIIGHVSAHGYGRNAMSTERALETHQRHFDTAVADLVERGERTLAGQLTSALGLGFRVDEAHRLGHARPELTARLHHDQQMIRRAYAAA